MKSLEELKIELEKLEAEQKNIQPYLGRNKSLVKQIRNLKANLNNYIQYQAQELEKDFKIEIATTLMKYSLNKEEYKTKDGSLIESRLDETLNGLKFLIADTRSYVNLFAYEEQFGGIKGTKEDIFKIMHKYNIYYLFIRNRSYYDKNGRRHIWIDFEYEKIKD